MMASAKKSGRGRRFESPASVSVNRFRSMAFMGDPWPTKRTGIFMEYFLSAESSKVCVKTRPANVEAGFSRAAWGRKNCAPAKMES